MYDAIYGNMYRETLWELNMEYMPSEAVHGRETRVDFEPIASDWPVSPAMTVHKTRT